LLGYLALRRYYVGFLLGIQFEVWINRLGDVQDMHKCLVLNAERQCEIEGLRLGFVAIEQAQY
jgi:hypothetical protein